MNTAAVSDLPEGVSKYATSTLPNKRRQNFVVLALNRM